MGDILAFPRSRAHKTRSDDVSPSQSPAHGRAEILFFTGIRYERADRVSEAPGKPTHPPSRPRRKRA